MVTSDGHKIDLGTDRVTKPEKPFTLESLRKLKRDILESKNWRVAMAVVGRKQMEELEKYSRDCCRLINNKFEDITITPIPVDNCMEMFTQEEVDLVCKLMRTHCIGYEALGSLLVMMRKARKGDYAV